MGRCWPCPSGGRIAGYVIHPPAGLTPAQKRRAAELGPSDVTAPASPAALTESAGLTIVVVEDVTDAFRATAAALRVARRALEEELRGIDEGVLCRSLIMAHK